MSDLVNALAELLAALTELRETIHGATPAPADVQQDGTDN